MSTTAQNKHAELMAAALAQIEHIKIVIQRNADQMCASPWNWGLTGDMGAILERLNNVTE